MSYKDLREWINLVEDLGELQVLEDAHWDLEIGVVAEEVISRKGPAMLFDRIADYPQGFRVLVGALSSKERQALTLGLPPNLEIKELVSLWREKSRNLKPIPPKFVEDGAVMENTYYDDDVDMLKFPSPKWHEHDGGRFIGTGCVVITRDPDEEWANLGVYRVMVHDKSSVGLFITPGKHGRLHRDKWFGRGEPMPVAVSFGHDPAIFMGGAASQPYGVSEYEHAGALKGEAIEVMRGPITGLPIPAHSEIVIEGYMHPGDLLPEGPFGEWTGYYASDERPEPVIRIKGLYHRTNPIILGQPPGKPTRAPVSTFTNPARVHEALEKAGMVGISSVWCHEVGGGRCFTVVGINQRYAGHAKQVATLTSTIQPSAYLGRWVVVVDDDIDVMDLKEVVWAMATRVDPAGDIDILRNMWSGPLDPMLSPEQKKRGEFFNSRAIVDATRPFAWRDQFPRVAESSPEIREKFFNKWKEKMGW